MNQCKYFTYLCWKVHAFCFQETTVSLGKGGNDKPIKLTRKFNNNPTFSFQYGNFLEIIY